MKTKKCNELFDELETLAHLLNYTTTRDTVNTCERLLINSDGNRKIVIAHHALHNEFDLLNWENGIIYSVKTYAELKQKLVKLL